MKGLDKEFLDNQDKFINNLMNQNIIAANAISKEIEDGQHLTTLEALNNSAKIIRDGLNESANITFGKTENRMDKIEEMNKMNEMLRNKIKNN